jgi:hypothetical protein
MVGIGGGIYAIGESVAEQRAAKQLARLWLRRSSLGALSAD